MEFLSELKQLVDISPLTWPAIAVASFCGSIVGIERQWSGKPAGIRTSLLICLGCYVYVAISGSIEIDNGDPSRVMGQIITGIGFLGAGVMLTRDGLVIGVTSAAVIWMLAAIGCLVGFGNHKTAILVALLTVFILVGVNFFERMFKKLKRGVHKDEES